MSFKDLVLVVHYVINQSDPNVVGEAVFSERVVDLLHEPLKLLEFDLVFEQQHQDGPFLHHFESFTQNFVNK